MKGKKAKRSKKYKKQSKKLEGILNFNITKKTFLRSPESNV